MYEQSSSDPLPYVQVDRAVRLKAISLAGLIQTTVQHAIGSLVEFWELCGDPRELEKIILATEPGKEPEVVLTKRQAEAKFELASTKTVDVDLMVELGLLEDRGESVRVRGMSRYLAPVARRLQARLAASRGGKASAESRKKSLGTAQPPPQIRSSEPRSVAEANPEAVVEANAEAAPNTAVSGQRSSKSKALKALSTSSTDELLVFDYWRQETGHLKAQFDTKRQRAVRERLKDYSVDDLRRAVDGCLLTPHNQGKNDRGEVYDDLELICRDAAHVDRFMRNASDPPVGRAERATYRATASDVADGRAPYIGAELYA